MQMVIKNLEDLLLLSNYIKKNYWHHKIFCFWGDLGVGKTQLIKFLIPQCKVTSPSFALLNIYEDKYWHFDLYKKDAVPLWEMEELGFNSLWETPDSKCFIEWSENLSFSIDALHIKFAYDTTNSDYRHIKIKENTPHE